MDMVSTPNNFNQLYTLSHMGKFTSFEKILNDWIDINKNIELKLIYIFLYKYIELRFSCHLNKPQQVVDMNVFSAGRTVKITLKELEQLVALGHQPKINSPTGYVSITETYRKKSEGLRLVFDYEDEIICSTEHLIQRPEGWVYAKDLIVGESTNGRRLTSLESVPEQSWVDFTVDADHHSYYHKGLVHHNSGKSQIIYLIVRFLLEQIEEDIMIVVPTISLTDQLLGDFKSYVNDDFDVDEYCAILHGGVKKTDSKPPRVLISTYQSLIRKPKEFFNRFQRGALIVDECLSKGTKIKTPYGNKNIEDIQPGDKVISFNETTQEFETDNVIKLHENLMKSESADMIQLEFDDGSSIQITDNHKVMTKRGWVEAGDLNEDDEVFSS